MPEMSVSCVLRACRQVAGGWHWALAVDDATSHNLRGRAVHKCQKRCHICSALRVDAAWFCPATGDGCSSWPAGHPCGE